MPAGTILLTQNSDVVNGANTVFTTDVSAGDVISATANGITYTLKVQTVTSNTSMKLEKPYPGFTASNLAYYVLPPTLLAQITAQLAYDTQYLLRGYITDKDMWMKLLTESQNEVTITAPDGSQITGPTWKYLVDLVEQATSVDPNPPPTTHFGLTKNRAMSVTTTAALDLSKASNFLVTLNSPNCVITFTNPSTLTDVTQEIRIKLKQGNGTNKVSWPSTVKWPNGVEPRQSYTAGKVDEFVFLSDDKGVSWSGFFAGAAF